MPPKATPAAQTAADRHALAGQSASDDYADAFWRGEKRTTDSDISMPAKKVRRSAAPCQAPWGLVQCLKSVRARPLRAKILNTVRGPKLQAPRTAGGEEPAIGVLGDEVEAHINIGIESECFDFEAALEEHLEETGISDLVGDAMIGDGDVAGGGNTTPVVNGDDAGGSDTLARARRGQRRALGTREAGHAMAQCMAGVLTFMPWQTAYAASDVTEQENNRMTMKILTTALMLALGMLLA